MGKKTLTFEEALARLDEIVAGIESGETPLEQSIAKYAEGIALLKQCRGILDQAEQKIQLLSSGPDGSLTVNGELEDHDEDA